MARKMTDYILVVMYSFGLPMVLETSTTNMGDNFINRSDILGSIWAMHYYGMGANISRIIEWGTEEKKWDYVGVAQAVRAWGWMTLTDTHDDVILREAFRP